MEPNLSVLLRLLLLNQCGLNPRNDYQDNYGNLKNGEKFDFIVVGGGSAGAVVASRLSENPNWNVLLVEAGGYPTVDVEVPGNLNYLQGNPEYDWMYTTQPSNTSCLGFEGGKCRWARGKVLGGSSSINYMVYLQGLPKDYDNWRDLGNDGWGWDDLQIYFNKVLSKIKPTYTEPYNKLHENIQRGIKEAGFKTSKEHEVNSGGFETLSSIFEGARMHTAKAYLRGLNRKNLKLLTNALAERIIFKKKRAIGVEVFYKNKSIKLYASKEIVVSAGSINTPKLLMLSGIGPNDDLKRLNIEIKADLQVGKNLQDHFTMYGIFIALDSIPNNTFSACYSTALYCDEKSGPLSQAGLISVMWFINVFNQSDYPNVQIHEHYYDVDSPEAIRFDFKNVGINRKNTDDVIKVNKKSNILSMLPTLSQPKSRGFIAINTTDPSETPLLYPNYLAEQADLETMLVSVDFIKTVLATPAMRSLNARLLEIKPPNCREFKFDTRDFWECSFRNMGATVFHQVGTCKMGPDSDPEAVVDARLRVKKVKNLRVVDGSIMPNIISRNTNAACIMIGEKGADLIKADWS